MRRLTCHHRMIAAAFAFALGALPVAALAAPSGLQVRVPVESPAAITPRILFGGIPLPVSSPALVPFRDSESSNDVCAAPEMLAPLGITYLIDDQTGQVTLAGPDGAKTITVPPHRVAGKPGVFVPVIAVVEGLGGKCEWDAAGTTLYTRAVLTSAEMIGGQLRLHASFPILPTVQSDNGGKLVIIDIPGAEIGALAKGLNLSAPNVLRTRTGQFSDDVARIALDLKEPGAFTVLGDKPALQVVLNPADPALLPTRIGKGVPTSAQSAPFVRAAAAATKTVVKAGKAAALPCVVSGVGFRRVGDDKAQFLVRADRAPTVRTALSKGRLTIDLLNATLSTKAALEKWDHPFLKAVQLAANGSNAARLVLDLTRAVCYTIRPTDKGSFLLELTLPKSATGKLAGKTVIVDPGHGGQDGGAHGINGANEKNVTLAIGTQLAQQLRDAGANVILTRSGDYFIPVDDRPQVGNRAGADFFISVHADSADRSHVVNGSTVYFHMDWASCRTLAQCIADRMADLGSIRSKGVHSDGLQYGGRFVNGYGVLRLSQMVAVLVECGYMTHSGDVGQMCNPATQKKIAAAIMAGLRDYIEGNPYQDTRFINPQPDAAQGGTVPSTENGNVESPLPSRDTPLPLIPAAPPAGDTPASPVTDPDGAH